jgi:hypothetical protein
MFNKGRTPFLGNVDWREVTIFFIVMNLLIVSSSVFIFFMMK